MTKSKFLVFSILLTLPLLVHAANDDKCFYINDTGSKVYKSNRSLIPQKFRENSYCPGDQNVKLASTKDIEITREKQSSFESKLGKVDLRWALSVERVLGRSPERAVITALDITEKFLVGKFPESVLNSKETWKIVFIDSNLPKHQIPTLLTKNCHPGWTVPPAEIYIIPDRLNGCTNIKIAPADADAELLRVLLHEIGHAIEFRLLGYVQNPHHQYAEGFATWFEREAARKSSLARPEQIANMHQLLARQSFSEKPNNFKFKGTGQDYVRMSLYYRAISERYDIAKVVEFLGAFAKNKFDFEATGKSVLGWDLEKFDNQAKLLALQ